jgi:hypothetical protein
MNREFVLADMKEFFALKTWQPDRFRSFLERYEATPEMFMYRLTEVLPRYFGIRLHFLRFNHEAGDYRLVKHLNMSQVLIPGGTGVNEHYCRRWLAIRILQKLESDSTGRKKVDEPILDAQFSRFVDTDARFFCIAMARHLALNRSATSSVSLGFRFDHDFERKVRFANDPKITRLDINGTCERCRLSLQECRERVSPPHLLTIQQTRTEIEEELNSLR